MADELVVIIDDVENEKITNEKDIIDVDKEYETEEGEIDEDEIKSNKSDVPCLNISSDQDEAAADEAAPEPLKATFEVNFRSMDEFDKLSEAVLSALKASKTVGEPQYEYVISGKVIQAFGIEGCTLDDELKVENDEKSNDSTDFGDALNRLFTIDSTPATKLEIAEVPSYKRHSRDVLDDEVKRKFIKNDDDCPRPKPTTACFNCGSLEHGIRDCLMPRNPQRIAKAKKARAKGERYHVDVDQRFAHIKPGEISEKLRKALGLRKNELPSFFYSMRNCGYPPGWLENAKVSHSGLAMFNTNDDVLKAEEDSSESEIKYDTTKIIDFPGFNVMPKGYIDNYKYYNVPSYSQEFSKEAMIAALGDAAIKGFKRKKLKDHNESSALENTQIDLTEVCGESMEIADDDIEEKNVEFTRPLPPPASPPNIDESLPPLPPQSATADSTTTSITAEILSEPASEIATANLVGAEVTTTVTAAETTNEARVDSPTLEELQAQQRALLLKLSNGEDESQKVEEAIKVETAAAPTQTAAAAALTNEIETPTTPATAPSTPLPQRTNTDPQAVIKTSHIGTPVLKFSPFDKIPATDNFKVGVSDVINFENLPDSTGKYEAMKDLLQKVRQAKKRLAEDD